MSNKKEDLSKSGDSNLSENFENLSDFAKFFKVKGMTYLKNLALYKDFSLSDSTNCQILRTAEEQIETCFNMIAPIIMPSDEREDFIGEMLQLLEDWREAGYSRFPLVEKTQYLLNFYYHIKNEDFFKVNS